jgi:hypothetical protein
MARGWDAEIVLRGAALRSDLLAPGQLDVGELADVEPEAQVGSGVQRLRATDAQRAS